MGIKDAVKQMVVESVCASVGIPPEAGKKLLDMAEKAKQNQAPEASEQAQSSSAPRMTYTKTK